jgi:hypothetical protein
LLEDHLDTALMPWSTPDSEVTRIYGDDNILKDENINSLPNHVSDVLLLPLLYRDPSAPLFATEKEAFCFTFFQERTGPEFSGFFDR